LDGLWGATAATELQLLPSWLVNLSGSSNLSFELEGKADYSTYDVHCTYREGPVIEKFSCLFPSN
jgi:hypothetical protein